jgi:hypothetical protein
MAVFSDRFGKILADLKVVWRAKIISGGLPISRGLRADFTNFAWFCFCLADLAVLESLLAKKQFFSHFFLHKKKKIVHFVPNIFKKKSKKIPGHF